MTRRSPLLTQKPHHSFSAKLTSQGLPYTSRAGGGQRHIKCKKHRRASLVKLHLRDDELNPEQLMHELEDFLRKEREGGAEWAAAGRASAKARGKSGGRPRTAIAKL